MTQISKTFSITAIEAYSRVIVFYFSQTKSQTLLSRTSTVLEFVFLNLTQDKIQLYSEMPILSLFPLTHPLSNPNLHILPLTLTCHQPFTFRRVLAPPRWPREPFFLQAEQVSLFSFYQPSASA